MENVQLEWSIPAIRKDTLRKLEYIVDSCWYFVGQLARIRLVSHDGGATSTIPGRQRQHLDFFYFASLSNWILWQFVDGINFYQGDLLDEGIHKLISLLGRIFDFGHAVESRCLQSNHSVRVVKGTRFILFSYYSIVVF